MGERQGRLRDCDLAWMVLFEFLLWGPPRGEVC